MPAAQKLWKLSPSDFGFLWGECPKCFYLKVTQKFSRPGMMPRIFTEIDTQMRECFNGKRTEEFAPMLGPGSFDCSDQRVRSGPITRPGRNSLLYLNGRIDALVRFDDKSFAIVDFKTTSQSATSALTYSRQLHAYAYALENAAPGELALKPIVRMGLLVFAPRAFQCIAQNASLSGSLTWHEIPRNDSGFLAYLDEVSALLDSPSIPAPAPGCAWCGYREQSRANNW
jgi:PD-(D/E)XK nuclease superfamily